MIYNLKYNAGSYIVNLDEKNFQVYSVKIVDMSCGKKASNGTISLTDLEYAEMSTLMSTKEQFFDLLREQVKKYVESVPELEMDRIINPRSVYDALYYPYLSFDLYDIHTPFDVFVSSLLRDSGIPILFFDRSRIVVQESKSMIRVYPITDYEVIKDYTKRIGKVYLTGAIHKYARKQNVKYFDTDSTLRISYDYFKSLDFGDYKIQDIIERIYEKLEKSNTTMMTMIYGEISTFEDGFFSYVCITSDPYEEQKKWLKDNLQNVLRYYMKNIPKSHLNIIGDIAYYKPVYVTLLRDSRVQIEWKIKRIPSCVVKDVYEVAV